MHFPFKSNEDCPEFAAFDRVLGAVVRELMENGYRRFYVGMAEGADLWTAGHILRLRSDFDGAELIPVLPYESFGDGMSTPFRERFREVLECAEPPVVIAPGRTSDCFRKRNAYLVSHAHALLAVCNERCLRSGTVQTVRMAQKRGLPVTFLHPQTLEVRHTPVP